MKILIVTHDKYHYKNRKRRMRWSWLPYYFDKLGHKIEYVAKPKWIYYPLIYLRFKPDIVIGIGKTGALITALHHKLNPKAKFIFDLNDHPAFYKNVDFLIKNHDFITTPSYYYYKKYNCNAWIMNGSNFKPLKCQKFSIQSKTSGLRMKQLQHNTKISEHAQEPLATSPNSNIPPVCDWRFLTDKIEYDIIYIGQTHSIYNIEKIKKECEKNNIKLKIISELPTDEVPKYIAKSKLCLYPISWDASAKMTDYAAMGKAVIAIQPNLSEKINYPAYYTEDLINGIKFLLKNNKKIKELEKQSLIWFKKYSGTWKEQTDKYLKIIQSLVLAKER